MESAWSPARQIASEFSARRPHNGQYQTLHLTRDEVDAALEVLFRSASARARLELAESSLAELSIAPAYHSTPAC